jgi:hypothetical protein
MRLLRTFSHNKLIKIKKITQTSKVNQEETGLMTKTMTMMMKRAMMK